MPRYRAILRSALRAYSKDKCSSFAAAIAYYALLSIFPLAVFAVSVAGYVLRDDPSAQQRIIDTLMRNLPLNQGEGQQTLEHALEAVTTGRAGLGLAGALGAAYSASALFAALRGALNTVFNVERPRPLVQGKLIDLAMTLGLGLLLLLSLALTALFTLAQQFSNAWFGDLSALLNVLFALGFLTLPPLVSAAIFAVAYRVIPHADLRWRDTLLGALVAAFLFEGLKFGFAQYLTHFGNYDAVYGALGFVIAFLFFAYLGGQIVLFGAELTRAYVEVMTGAVPSVRPAVPRRRQSPVRRAAAAAKGLFVAPPAHHDDRLPYRPAGDRGLLTDHRSKRDRR